MREALAPKLPVSARAELQSRLKQALESENYELAAILRDELRLMGAGRPAPAEGNPATRPDTAPPGDPQSGQDRKKPE